MLRNLFARVLMRQIELGRILRRGTIGIAILLSACGGGGGGTGSNVIPPFWSQSGVVVADFNGDGRVDVAVATDYIAGPPPHPGYVQMYLQTAAGSFDAPVQYVVGPDPWGMSVGDVDGDGRLDLVVATPSTVPPQVNVIGDSGGVSILRQDSAQPGRFLASQWIATGGLAEAVAIGNLDGDGLADLVVADGVQVNGRALVFLQNPTQPGAFLTPTFLQTGRGSEDLVVVDVNGDGRNDVVLAAYDSIVVFYQSASGGFGPATVLSAGLRTSGVAVADLDGDGRADIVAANAGNAPAGGTGGATVRVFRQTSPGGFVATDIAVADGARRLAIGDLNGDAVPDIAVVSLVYQSQSTPSRVSVMQQFPTSRGQFAPPTVYNGSYSGSFIALGDVNGDGRADLILNDGPSVLLQNAAAPGTFDAVHTLR